VRHSFYKRMTHVGLPFTLASSFIAIIQHAESHRVRKYRQDSRCLKTIRTSRLRGWYAAPFDAHCARK
jgi:hypothetical protein